MPPLTRALTDDRGIASALAATALALYAVTLSRHVGLIDSGALTLAAWEFGVPHPPGFPLYVLVAYPFAHAPIGSIAARVNFASAVCAAVAVAGVFLLTRSVLARLSPRKVSAAVSITGAAGAALTFMTLRTTWAYATTAEVYTLSMCLSLWIWLLLLRESPMFRTAAALFGLALGAHPPIVVSTVPALLLWFVRTRGIARAATRNVVTAIGCAWLGLGIYALLPLAAHQSPELNWGDPATLDRFWAHISGWQYRGRSNASLSGTARALSAFATILVEQYGSAIPLGLLLAPVGAAALFRRNTAMASLLTTWAMTNVLLTAWMNADWLAGSERGAVVSDDVAAYYLPAFAVCAVFTGVGFVVLLARLPAVLPHRRTRVVVSAGLIGVVVLQPLRGNWADNNRAHDSIARNYVDDVLRSAGSNGLVLLRDWNLSSPLMYVQGAERLRRDVIALDLTLLEKLWYLNAVAQRHPILFDATSRELTRYRELLHDWEEDPPARNDDVTFRAAISAAYDELVLAVVTSHRQSRPVYVTLEVATGSDGKGRRLAERLNADFQLVPGGLLFQVHSGAAGLREPTAVPLHLTPLRGRARGSRERATPSEHIAGVYRDLLVSRGLYFEAHGRCLDALASLGEALLIDPRSGSATVARQRCLRATAPTR
jgi:hypothetical protein